MTARSFDPAGEIMVLAIGNPDRGDDGVGAAVLSALQGRLPPGVTIRAAGDDLLSLVEDWGRLAALICVDAAAPMGTPGRAYRIDIGSDVGADPGMDLAIRQLPLRRELPSSHAFGLSEAIDLARVLGLAPKHVVLFAVEGASFELGTGLSPPVAQSVAGIAAAILDAAARLLRPS